MSTFGEIVKQTKDSEKQPQGSTFGKIIRQTGYQKGERVGGMRIVAAQSNTPIHYGTHKEPGVYDITERDAKAKYGSMEKAAETLRNQGFVVAVRYKGQRKIASNHLHFADPDVNPAEAKRLQGQKGTSGPVRLVEPSGKVSYTSAKPKPSAKPAPAPQTFTPEWQFSTPQMEGPVSPRVDTMSGGQRVTKPAEVTSKPAPKSQPPAKQTPILDLIPREAALTKQDAVTRDKAIKDRMERLTYLVNTEVFKEGVNEQGKRSMKAFDPTALERLNSNISEWEREYVRRSVEENARRYQTEPEVREYFTGLLIGGIQVGGALAKAGSVLSKTQRGAKLGKALTTTAKTVEAATQKGGLKGAAAMTGVRGARGAVENVAFEAIGAPGRLPESALPAAAFGAGAGAILPALAGLGRKRLPADAVVDAVTKRLEAEGYAPPRSEGVAPWTGQQAAPFGENVRMGQPKPVETMADGGGKPKPAPVEAKLSDIEAKRQAIRDRMAQRAAEPKPEAFKDKPGQRGAVLSPDDLLDYAELGKLYIQEGAIKFADWSAKMIEEAKRVGHDIRPHLKRLFKEARRGGNGYRFAITSEGLEKQRVIESQLDEVQNRLRELREDTVEILTSRRDPRLNRNLDEFEADRLFNDVFDQSVPSSRRPYTLPFVRTLLGDETTNGLVERWNKAVQAEQELNRSWAKIGFDDRVHAARERIAGLKAKRVNDRPRFFDERGSAPLEPIDSELLEAYTDLARAHVANGLNTFQAFAKQMIDEAKQLGHDIKPYLGKMWAEMQGEGAGKGVVDAGVSKARVDAKRQSQGFDPVPIPKFQAKSESIRLGKTAVDNGDIVPESVAQEIIDNPRPGKATELGAMRYRLAQIEQAVKTASPEEQARLLEMQNTLHRGLRRAGTSWSETGHATQGADAVDPMSLGEILQASRDNKGRALTPEEIARTTGLHAKYETALAKEQGYTETIGDLNKRIADLQKEVASGKGLQSLENRRVKTPQDFSKMDSFLAKNTVIPEATIRAAEQRLLSKMGQMRSGVDPTMVSDLAIVIGGYVEAGIRFEYGAMRQYLREKFNANDADINAAYQKATNDKRLAALKKRYKTEIGKSKQTLATGDIPGRQPDLVLDAEAIALKEQAQALRAEVNKLKPQPDASASEAARLEATKKRLLAQIDQMQSGRVKGKPEPVKWDAETVRLRKLRGAIEEQLAAEVQRGTPRKLKQTVVSLFNSNLAWLLAWDNSYIGRQGLDLLLHQPSSWWKMAKNTNKALISEGQALLLDDAIVNHKYYPLAQQAGLEHTSLSAHAALASAEEPSMYIRSLGKLGKVLRPFDRAFTTGGNWDRHLPFYKWAEAQEAAGIEIALEDAASKARFFNVLSKRGDLGRFGKFQPELNTVFISARNFFADWQGPAQIASKDPWVRKQTASLWVKRAIAYTAFGLAVNATGKAQVELDPRKPGFGDMRVGNTRFNLLGGAKSVIKTTWAFGLATYNHSRFAKEKPGPYDSTPTDVGMRFLGTKITPSMQALNSLRTGEDWLGNKVTGAQILKNWALPFNTNEVEDAWKDAGPGMAGAVAVSSFHGVNSSTYEDSPRVTFEANKDYQKALGDTEVGKSQNRFEKGDTVKKLDDKQWDAFQTETYNAVGKAVKTLVGTSEFKSATGKEKAQMKSEAIKSARDTVRDKWKAKLGLGDTSNRRPKREGLVRVKRERVERE